MKLTTMMTIAACRSTHQNFGELEEGACGGCETVLEGGSCRHSKLVGGIDYDQELRYSDRIVNFFSCLQLFKHTALT